VPAEAGPLLEQIGRDAAATAAARLADARAEADRVTTAAATRRERQRVDAVGERERALARQRESAQAEVAQQTLLGVLTARAVFLDRVFAAAERELQALERAPDLAQRLAPLLADALPFVDAAAVHVRCATAARAAVEAALASLGRPDTTITVDDAVPLGALIENRAATVRVDATFGARLRRLRPTLQIEAVHLLEAPAR